MLGKIQHFPPRIPLKLHLGIIDFLVVPMVLRGRVGSPGLFIAARSG